MTRKKAAKATAAKKPAAKKAPAAKAPAKAPEPVGPPVPMLDRMMTGGPL